MIVSSVVIGNNADLIAEVARLYLPEKARVADVTYGKGVFWRKVKPFLLNASDLNHPNENLRHDFRKLPYKNGEFDVTVFDPPYVHNPGKGSMLNARYENHDTTAGMYHVDIMRLYRKGIVEAARVTKCGGTVWVKCKDEIESNIQCWSHVEVYAYAKSLGLYVKDLFVLVPKSNVPPDERVQRHARKRHSYLWVFEVCSIEQLKRRDSVESK
jgi:methylase of polypeptide subunit release factors